MNCLKNILHWLADDGFEQAKREFKLGLNRQEKKRLQTVEIANRTRKQLSYLEKRVRKLEDLKEKIDVKK